MEIERKFLWNYDFELDKFIYVRKSRISDYYFNEFCRLRCEQSWSDTSPKYCITIKSKGTLSREEYEFPVLVDDVKLYNLGCYLDKIRLIIPYFNVNFQVNIFDKVKYEEQPLILVEVELESAEQKVELPPWVGREVTNDLNFYGFNLFKYNCIGDK